MWSVRPKKQLKRPNPVEPIAATTIDQELSKLIALKFSQCFVKAASSPNAVKYRPVGRGVHVHPPFSA